ncbi:MAG: heavy metal sensor histidine kinase [Akkermansiaceae bacterium]|jgi:two-component system heavy metal sensor histidine kinase CusS|nr:heavy metal sensor histidine kinase [Akkermansiaceae bacterium]
MPSRQRRPLPITVRLVIGYTLGCVACLLFVGWLSNHTLRQRFEKKNAGVLADHLAEVRQAVIDHPGNLHEAMELILVSATTHRENPCYGRLCDEHGAVIAANERLDEKVPDATAFPRPVGAAENPGIQQLSRLSHPGGEFFLLSAKVRQAGDAPELIYQVALDAGHVEEWLTGYNRMLGFFIAIAAAASALFGWLVARGGLAPLRDITRSVRLVTAAGLNERLSVNAWPAELAALAGEFDRMLERLDDSFKRLSQFTADAAHEFRTPLNNLMGATSLLLSRERPAAELREALVAHLEQYERLNRMVESLLFLARADGNTEVPDMRPLDAGTLMREVVEFFTPLAESHGVTLACSGDATLRAVESLLRMALINLVANALRFTPAGGTVTLAIGPSDPGRTVLTVTDTGCGIPPEHLPKIFDRFYRVESARSSTGAGLGLALVRTIMTIHGGSVTATSKPGRGTTFQLVFPAPDLDS